MKIVIILTADLEWKMKMKEKCVLISGPTIAIDKEFCEGLETYALIIRNSENNQLLQILASQQVDLILLEIMNKYPSEIEIIKEIKTSFPNTIILLIDGNGNSNLIAKAFRYGAKDAFKKPYHSELIEERVKVLLNDDSKLKRR